MSGLQNVLGVPEITVGATHMKHTTCREQATEFFEEASSPSTPKNRLFKNMCNWMVSVNIPRFKLQTPEFLEKYYKHNIPEQSST
jgi:hypothetical protein